MTFSTPTDLEGGLYFFNGQRQTVAETSTFPVYEPLSGKKKNVRKKSASFFFLMRAKRPPTTNAKFIGKVVAQCPAAGAPTVDKIVHEAAKAQPGWGNTVPLERGKILNKVAELIRENLEEIARWEVKTNGKPITEARMDIASSADTFQFFAGIAPAVMKGTIK